MNKNFIRIYKWDEDEEIYKVTQVPILNSNHLSIQYNILDNKIYSSNDETKPINPIFSIDDKMLSVVIDKTKCVREGIIEPFMYVEYGLTCLVVKTVIAFAVVKSDTYYKLMYKLPIIDKSFKQFKNFNKANEANEVNEVNKFKEIRTFNKLDGTYSIKEFDTSEKIQDNNSKFLYIPEIQIPLFEHKLNKMILDYKISQTIEDVIKENSDSDPEQLKIEFGNFIIDELKHFVSGIIMNEIDEIKKKVGSNHYNKIYKIVKFLFSSLNVKMIPYAELANKRCKFDMNNKTYDIEFIEYEPELKIINDK